MDLENCFGFRASFQFNFQSVAGRNYVVEASTNLFNWTPIWTNHGTGGEPPFWDPEAGDHARRFYRVNVQ